MYTFDRPRRFGASGRRLERVKCPDGSAEGTQHLGLLARGWNCLSPTYLASEAICVDITCPTNKLRKFKCHLSCVPFSVLLFRPLIPESFNQIREEPLSFDPADNTAAGNEPFYFNLAVCKEFDFPAFSGHVHTQHYRFIAVAIEAKENVGRSQCHHKIKQRLQAAILLNHSFHLRSLMISLTGQTLSARRSRTHGTQNQIG